VFCKLLFNGFMTCLLYLVSLIESSTILFKKRYKSYVAKIKTYHLNQLGKFNLVALKKKKLLIW
jgi:hypothetical protein